MGSVASTNAGLTDLLQTLSSENSPLVSTISSPSVEAALEKAPASDIVQLSDEALQLQVTDSLFGGSTTSSTSGTTPSSLFSELESIDSSANTGSSSSTSGASLTDQLAAYQGSSQLQEAQSLLGITQPTANSNSLFDVFA